MRTIRVSLAAALLLVSVGAAAQEAASGAAPAAATPTPTAGDVPFVNQIDVGGRGTFFGSGSDTARFQRYRDVRDGATLDRVRLFRDTPGYELRFQADHVGYRD